MRKDTLFSIVCTAIGFVGVVLSPGVGLVALFGAIAFIGSALAGHALLDEHQSRVAPVHHA